MRAARIRTWGTAPVVEDVEEPVRAEGESLVRIDAAPLSHLDLTVASGEFGLRPLLPYVPGVEGSGTVLASETVVPGTRVIFREGALGLRTDGTWRERASVPDEALVPLSVPLDPSVAATFFSPLTTAYAALHDIADLREGETVLITGAAGAVGSAAAQLALRAGAKVIGLVSRAARLTDVPDGVRGVALTDESAVTALGTSREADLLLDTTGGQGLAERIDWVRPGGRAVSLGYTAGNQVNIDLPAWLFADVALLPVNMIRREDRAHEIAARLLPEVAAGRLRVPYEEISLDQIEEGLERLSKGAVRGRAVIRF